jgi:methylamine utilization protein MauE
LALVWTVPFFVAAELLLWSGGAKLLRPESTVHALRAAHLPAGAPAVRLLGAAEILAGGICLVRPSAASALVLSGLYVGFAGFVLLALAAEQRPSSCGCFGTTDTPPSWLHVAADLLAAVAGLAVLGTPRAVLDVAAGTPFLGIPFAVGLGLAAYLAALTLTTLPTLFFSYRGREAQP